MQREVSIAFAMPTIVPTPQKLYFVSFNRLSIMERYVGHRVTINVLYHLRDRTENISITGILEENPGTVDEFRVHDKLHHKEFGWFSSEEVNKMIFLCND